MKNKKLTLAAFLITFIIPILLRFAVLNEREGRKSGLDGYILRNLSCKLKLSKYTCLIGQDVFAREHNASSPYTLSIQSLCTNPSPTPKPSPIGYPDKNACIDTSYASRSIIKSSSTASQEAIPEFFARLITSPQSITPHPIPYPTPTQHIDQEALSDTGELTLDKRAWTKFQHKDIIAKTAEKYVLDPQIIYATIMTESEGNPYAFRYEPHIKDASLCMGQILISTARRLGFYGSPREMYKPEVCIDLIGKYHRMMIDTYGDLTPQQLARAYNTGSPWKRPVWGHLARFNKWLNETT